jgi:hemerythrin-like domain-containing protein
MKRHESIVVISREHHFGLLFCWKIRQGLKKQVPAERMRPYVKYFWDSHLKRHFEEEETLLFAAVQDELTERAYAEHREIRQLVESLSTQPEPFRLLADAVDRHIRFEERILFPHIEKTLPETRLAEIGKRLQQLHQQVEKDDYADEFWT